MEKFKSVDLGQVQAEIEAKNTGNALVRSMKNAKNLTANNNMGQIHPVGDRVLIQLKAWPSQSAEGIFVPDSYTIIRGEQYIAQVVEAGPEATIVSKGDVVVSSMYSGHHITTKSGHAKIISETDILAYKKEEKEMKHLSFDPKTFIPGMNYILVKLIEKKTIKTKSGIISSVGEDDPFSKNDVVTKTAEVIALGPINEYGKKFAGVEKGSTVILDAYVGIEMNPSEISSDDKYRVMMPNDILGYVK